MMPKNRSSRNWILRCSVFMFKDMVLFELASYQLATAALKYPYISISSYNTKTIEVTQFSQFKKVRSITKMQLF